MHEMSLISSLIKSIRHKACEDSLLKVNKVWLNVGTLSCVEDEALRFCFDALREDDTLLAQAELVINRCPATAECVKCGQKQPLEHFGQLCRFCQSSGLKVLEGTDVYIDKISAEVKD